MSDEKVADNYMCANALEHFKQRFLDPLKERAKKNHDYIFNGGYDKQCKEKGVEPDPKQVEKMKLGYDKLSFELGECKKMYDASFLMVQRHEHVINELARIRLGLTENIFWKGEMPAQLMKEQQDMMVSYLRDINKILATCKLEENE